jgi:hypothetical protein
MVKDIAPPYLTKQIRREVASWGSVLHTDWIPSLATIGHCVRYRLRELIAYGPRHNIPMAPVPGVQEFFGLIPARLGMGI